MSMWDQAADAARQRRSVLKAAAAPEAVGDKALRS